MTNEQIFVLVIFLVVFVVVGVMQASKYRHLIKRVILNRINVKGSDARQQISPETEGITSGNEPWILSTEESTKAELDRLQKLIEDRKQIARDADISHHLWDFYNSFFRQTGTQSLDRFVQFGAWYDVKVLTFTTKNGQNRFEFELKGARYLFVDDEENQGWSDNAKFFRLLLYDDSDRCLIEIPMKVRVHKLGRNYSVLLDGPRAFIPGDWVSDFINVKLKHQSMRNIEIREQKHQERLWEIEDLKERFGISD